ncbi:hypothetical protein ACFL6G_08120 [candidate division KSB1 bacterium]
MKRLLYLSISLILFSCGINTLFEPDLTLNYSSKIAFIDRSNSSRYVFIMNPDGSDKKVIAVSDNRCRDPIWSPDGSKLAYRTNYNLYCVDITRGHIHKLTNFSKSINFATWSPDGSKLAFNTDEIYTINVDGSDLTQLSSNNSSDLHPCWSPDNKKIYYISNVNGYREIYVINSDGSENKQLTFDQKSKVNLKLTGDGTKILFGCKRNIFVMNSDGSDIRNLTPGLRLDIDYSISPDDSQIAYVDGGDIWIMDFDGGKKINLTSDDNYNSDPKWSPDSNLIVFTVTGYFWLSSISYPDKDFSYIASIKKDSSELQRLTKKYNKVYHRFYAVWSPFIE